LKGFLPDECSIEFRDGFLAWLIEIAGLLVERTDGTLAFTHLSFQEYLTALHLANTVADHDQRFSAFQNRVREVHWWETLRLLAAQIESSNPEFLEIALRDLHSHSSALETTPSFLGTVLADGLGTESLLKEWTKGYLPLFVERWPQEADLCARAWKGTRQGKRKAALSRNLNELAVRQTWISWMRCEMLGEGWAPLLEPAKRATTRGIAMALQNSNALSRE